MVSVSNFAAKPFVQRACADPMNPQSVLSFFFGVNLFDDDDNNHHEDAKIAMKNGTFLNEMFSLWYGTSTEYDKLCHCFIPAIRAVGNREIDDEWNKWNDSIEGMVSQVILCDQLARICFRGTDEATEYDHVASEIAKELFYNVLPREITSTTFSRPIPEEEEQQLEGEFYYSPVLHFLISPLMHSEKLENHELGLKVIDFVFSDDDTLVIPDMLHPLYAAIQKSMLDHSLVLARFGRYPHLNKRLGRESTSDELTWLADTDNLPHWAQD